MSRVVDRIAATEIVEEKAQQGPILQRFFGDQGMREIASLRSKEGGGVLFVLGVIGTILGVLGNWIEILTIGAASLSAVLFGIIALRVGPYRRAAVPLLIAFLASALFALRWWDQHNRLGPQEIAEIAEIAIQAYQESEIAFVASPDEVALVVSKPDTKSLTGVADSALQTYKTALVDGASQQDALGLNDLEKSALDQSRTLASEVAQAAVTWKLIGEYAFIEDMARSINAYNEVLRLKPNDLVALNQLGQLYQRVGDIQRAEDTYLHLINDVAYTDQKSVANALGNLGLLARVRGDLDEAYDYLKRSLALNEQLGLSEGIAATLVNLGLVARTRGELDEAEDYLQRSLTLIEELGSKETTAATLGNLGLVAQTRGVLDEAEDYYKQSLALNEELGRKEGMANQLGNLGLIAQTRGDLDEAEAYFKQSLTLNEELGRREGIAASLGNLGLIARTRGDLDGAEAFHRRSLALNEELGRKEGMAIQLYNLGTIAFDRGDRASACAYYRQAEGLFAEIGMRRELAQTRALIAARCPDDAP